MHDLELLGEHLHAHARRRERKAERAVLALHPAGSEPELDPPARDVVGCRSGVGKQRGRPERRGGDERAETQLGRPRCESGERRPGVVRSAPDATVAGQVVVGAEERLEPARLAGVGERDPVRPGHVLLALDHEAEAHAGQVMRADANAPSVSSARP
jgi:hypothetical protein